MVKEADELRFYSHMAEIAAGLMCNVTPGQSIRQDQDRAQRYLVTIFEQTLEKLDKPDMTE